MLVDTALAGEGQAPVPAAPGAAQRELTDQGLSKEDAGGSGTLRLPQNRPAISR
jgi:hypothetical protein